MSSTPPGRHLLQDDGNRRRHLISIAGLLAVVLLANSVTSLFSLHYAGIKAQEDVALLRETGDALETARAAQVHFKKQVQEWKNILLRGHEPGDLERYRGAFFQEEASTVAELMELAGLAANLGLATADVGRIGESHAELGQRYRAALDRYDPLDEQSARKVDSAVRGIDRAATDAIDGIVEEIRQVAATRAEMVKEEAARRYRTLRRAVIVTTSLGIGIVLVFLLVSFGAGRKA